MASQEACVPKEDTVLRALQHQNHVPREHSETPREQLIRQRAHLAPLASIALEATRLSLQVSVLPDFIVMVEQALRHSIQLSLAFIQSMDPLPRHRVLLELISLTLELHRACPVLLDFFAMKLGFPPCFSVLLAFSVPKVLKAHHHVRWAPLDRLMVSNLRLNAHPVLLVTPAIQLEFLCLQSSARQVFIVLDLPQRMNPHLFYKEVMSVLLAITVQPEP